MKSVALALLVLAGSSPTQAAPVVTSDSDCPSAAEITAQVASLWQGERATSVSAHIRLDGAQLLIDLASVNEPVVTRSLPMESDCRSRAQAAALVIAAWLDMMSADPGGLPPAVPPTPALMTEPARPSPPRSTSRHLLGVAGYALIDAQGASALFATEIEWLRLAGWLGLRAGVSFPLPRTMAVGQGRARWWRPVLDLGMVLPLHGDPWRLTVDAGPALGLLVVAGKGFDKDQTDAVLSWGALAGLRLGYVRASGSTAWAELRGQLWPVAQSIRNNVVGTAPREAALPYVEAHLGLGCGPKCTLGPYCGDGILQAEDETCDDGNNLSGDGCSATCTCENAACGDPAPVCGDGKVDTNEACDDGNTLSGDGCSDTCKVEPCWATCGCNSSMPCTPVAICGNGVLDSGEYCDDGNARNGDGCSETCQIEPSWYCAEPGRPCSTVCGDGIVTSNEQCDDGNTRSQDGCSSTCQIEPKT